jgi:type IV secretory pathway VirB10-like protein
MEVSKTEEDLSRDEILLEEPHFDEESTILSARPVVPLEVVEAKSRSLRRILIGSAIVVALLIGVFAASFVYKLRNQQQASSATATDDSYPQSQPSLESGIAAIESHDPEPVVESQAPEPTALDKKQPDERTVFKNIPATSRPLILREPPPRNARNGMKSRKQEEAQDQPLEYSADQRVLDQELRRAERREERREDRREERRARRVEAAKHQGTDRDSRATDDLSRIREIFEGRPKP